MRAVGQRFVVGVAFAVLSAMRPDGDVVAAEEAAYRATMTSILESVRVLATASASLERFSSPEHEVEIVAALTEVSDQAAILAEHAGADSDEEEFLASALERYAGWTRRAYERGERERALGMLRQTADLCIACHTRQRGEGSALARSLLDSEDLAGLRPRERARLQVATRQFEAALATLEDTLPGVAPGDPRLVADLTTYLVVAIRVVGDDARALALVERLHARDELDPSLGAALAYWIADLRALIDSPPAPTLDAAAALIARAEARGTPAHAGLVDYVAASEIAQRLVSHARLSPGQHARAYLLLGISEMRLDVWSWIPRAELHLEQAIRAAPGTETAALAYERLTERLTGTYRAQAGRVPDEVAEHLEHLRALAYPRPAGRS